MEQLQPGREPAPTQLHMAPQVLAAICETIGTRKAESGGMLGGCRQTGEVPQFCFDADAQRNHVIYTPNTEFLNAVKRQWRRPGTGFPGSPPTPPPPIPPPPPPPQPHFPHLPHSL